MAQVQPPPSNPSHPSANGQPGPSSPSHSQPPPISWEGDRMFNVYIHDYFVKRGFHKAAKELVIEANIGNDAYPPINARQGFLFEWWNVFWLFFSAKTSGQGPDNVLLYFQWMQNQADRNRTGDPSRLGLPGQHRMIHRGGPPQNPMRPGPLLNGMPVPPVGQSQPPIGAQGTPYPMPGIPGGSQPPQHQQPQPGPPQTNGIMDPNNPNNSMGQNSQRPPSQQQSTRPVPQQQSLPPPSHPSAMPHLQPGQRPIPRPHAPGQFQSPTMAPAHPPGVPSHPSMGPPHMTMVPPGISQNAPHLGQHSHLMRGPPSQGGQPPNHSSPRGPAQTPAQGFQQPLMNPGAAAAQHPPGSAGSRSTTPAATSMVTHRSPHMVPNPSASPGQSMSDDMNRRFQMPMQGSRPSQQSMVSSHPQHSLPASQQPSRPGTSQSFSNPELQQYEEDLARIPPVFLASMKQQAGVPDREYTSLTDEEKTRLNEVFRRTISNFNGTLAPGSRPVRPGMQPMAGMMGPPSQASQLRPQQALPPQSQSQGPGTTQRGQKRMSTSPGDEGQTDVTPKDQSPPDRKRQRQSPQVGMGQSVPIGNDLNSNVAPLSQMTPMSGFPPGHPSNHLGTSYPGSGTPQFHNGAGFRPGQMGNPPMPGHPAPAAPNVNMMPMGSLTPSMGHAVPPGSVAPMNPALANQHIHQMPGSQSLAMSQQQQGPFRHPMTPGTHMHKMSGPMSGIPNQNATPDQGVTVTNRAQAQQNKAGSMMPPPSPAHRPESINVPKPTGMMPPPSQPTPGGSISNNSGPVKDQTAPSPARIDGTTGSSPSIRPESRSGAGVSAPQSSNPSSNSQGAPVNSLTPGPPGTTGTNNGNSATSAPSPSSLLSNRISPSTAAIGSLPRPQTSGPDGSSSSAQANNSTSSTTNGPAPPAPSLSAPPSTSAPSLAESLFTGFFDTMEDNFGLEGLENLDPNDFSQWIDMNPIN